MRWGKSVSQTVPWPNSAARSTGPSIPKETRRGEILFQSRIVPHKILSMLNWATSDRSSLWFRPISLGLLEFLQGDAYDSPDHRLAAVSLRSRWYCWPFDVTCVEDLSRTG
jgi:hypothetical protein